MHVQGGGYGRGKGIPARLNVGHFLSIAYGLNVQCTLGGLGTNNCRDSLVGVWRLVGLSGGGVEEGN